MGRKDRAASAGYDAPAMIGYLKGRVLQAASDVVLLDVGGVGYELHISLTTYTELARARGEGEAVELFVHTHLWSDGLALYGFATEREKHLFEKLIAVSGIGPRLARVILSGMAPEDLVAALAAGDVKRLTTIPGVGKKSAERMVLELRDKVDELGAPPVPATGRAASGDAELVSALVNLGYKEPQAEKAVRAAREDEPGGAFHELLRSSLRRISRV